MNFIILLTYVADVMHLIECSVDIAIMSIIFSTMVVGFLYAIGRLAIEKTLNFLPFF